MRTTRTDEAIAAAAGGATHQETMKRLVVSLEKLCRTLELELHEARSERCLTSNAPKG